VGERDPSPDELSFSASVPERSAFLRRPSDFNLDGSPLYDFEEAIFGHADPFEKHKGSAGQNRCHTANGIGADFAAGKLLAKFVDSCAAS